MKSGILPVSTVSEAHLKLAEKTFLFNAVLLFFFNLLSYEVEEISSILHYRQTR